MEQATAVDPNAPVSHEVDGRILTGVGVSSESLADTMERHAPESPDEAAPASTEAAEPVKARNEQGQFTKQSRGQRRFDELTREREEARREAADAKRERDELRARLSAPREPERQPEPKAEQTAAPQTRIKPTEDEVGTKYQTYGEYVEDLADWKAEQRLAQIDFDARIRTSIEADRASRTFSDHVNQLFTKGREAYPDFDAVLASGPGAAVELGARRDFIASRPNALELIYAIAKDGDLARKLASVSDLEFGLALASVAPAQAVANPASTPAVGSPVVPAPYQPVGTGSKTAAIPSSDLTKRAGFDFDKSGYREKRATERGIRR